VIGEGIKTSSKPDHRAARGAARIDRRPAENSFFHGVELEARSECAAERFTVGGPEGPPLPPRVHPRVRALYRG